MAASSGHGSKSRKLRDHILNCKCKTERWKELHSLKLPVTYFLQQSLHRVPKCYHQLKTKFQTLGMQYVEGSLLMQTSSEPQHVSVKASSEEGEKKRDQS